MAIPLWTKDMKQAEEWIHKVVPEWMDMPIVGAAVYLGHPIGPGKGEQVWKDPLEKVYRTCHGLGMGEARASLRGKDIQYVPHPNARLHSSVG